MARALRIEYPGAFYHVTCRGNARKSIFRDDQDRKIFLNRLSISLDNYQVALHAYVLMTNHFHFVLETPQGNLSEFMRHFNVTYTSYFNRRHRRVGHLYQGRFKAILVEADEYLLMLSRYVHLNPIRVARLKKMSVMEQLRFLEKYRWSSLRGYLSNEKRQAFVRYHRILDYVRGGHQESRQNYAEFLVEGITAGTGNPWEEIKGQVILGREKFVEQMRRQVKAARGQARELPSMKVWSVRWDAEALIRQVAGVLGKKVKDLCSRGGGLERAIMMECLHRYAHESQRAIGRRMGGVDYTWVSRMRGELRRAMDDNGEIKGLFQKVEVVLLTHK